MAHGNCTEKLESGYFSYSPPAESPLLSTVTAAHQESLAHCYVAFLSGCRAGVLT